MKTIILLWIFGLLSLAAPVWAEAQRDPPGYHHCVDRGNGVQLCEELPPTPDPCLAKMEAAMRKMEPLIFKTVVPSAIWHNSPAYKDAWELWDAAKRECWREP